MNKINLLEKKVGENSVEKTKGDNYGVTESYSRGGIKNFILAGSAIIVGLTYGCSLKFHPENVNPTEMALRTMAITGKAGTSRLSNRQRIAAGQAADMISNRNNSQENNNASGYINEDSSKACLIYDVEKDKMYYFSEEGTLYKTKRVNDKLYATMGKKLFHIPYGIEVKIVE